MLNNLTAVEELFSTNPNIDTITLSETHFCTLLEDNDNFYAIAGYNFEKRNRSYGKGVGVAIYVKDLEKRRTWKHCYRNFKK